MSLKLYEENDVQNIANAIREKGVEGSFKVSEMDDAVRSIPSGITGSIGKVVLEAYSVSDSQDATVPRTQYDENRYLSDYFTYSESTHKWTCHKAFDASIIFAVGCMQSSQGNPNCNLYINDTIVATVYARGRICYDYSVSTLSTVIDYSFKVGDVMYTGKPNSLGWEIPYLAISEGMVRYENLDLNYAEGSLQLSQNSQIINELKNVLVKGVNQ